MSKSKNADIPAMPQMRCDSWGKYHHTGGLTKREMFAMAAMQGMLSSADAEMQNCGGKIIIENAIWYADALLAALERTK